MASVTRPAPRTSPFGALNLDPFLAPIGVTVVLVLLPIVFGLGREGGMEWANFVPSSIQFLAQGVIWTVSVALAAILLSLPLATLFALGRLSTNRAIRWLCTAYIEGVRAFPVLLLIFYIFFRLGNAGFAFVPRDAMAVILAQTLYTAAVNAEIIRAGILSLPRGQFEASRSLGMTYIQMMRLVILPQTFRRVLPPLISQFTTVLKDTSLGSIIGTVELTRRTTILFQQYKNPLEAYYVAAIIYFVLNYILGRVSVALQARRRGVAIPRRVE
jgi:His/Glu/Gln/Arg/opine family amino acid ABC transporter permease subunit